MNDKNLVEFIMLLCVKLITFALCVEFSTESFGLQVFFIACAIGASAGITNIIIQFKSKMYAVMLALVSLMAFVMMSGNFVVYYCLPFLPALVIGCTLKTAEKNRKVADPA